MSRSKIEKDINQIILNDEQVPSSVLDNARAAIQQETCLTTKNYRLRSLRISIISVMLILGILLPVVIIQVYQYYAYYEKEIKSYSYDTVQEIELESIEAYNNKHSTRFLYLNLPIHNSYFLISDDQKYQGLEERYDYLGKEIRLHIQISSNYRFAEFEDLSFENEIHYQDILVYCTNDNVMTYIYFTTSDVNYYIFYDGNDIELDTLLDALC